MKKDIHRFTFDFTTQEHKRFKTRCSEDGISMRDVIRGLVNKYIEEKKELACCKNRSYEPNEETLESFKNIKDKKNLTEFTDLADLYKKSGIK